MGIKKIRYQLEILTRWFQKQALCLFGIRSIFYCQRDIEGKSKCTNQCDHCKEYYKPLEK